ncbi:hypothetical protein LJB94_03010, partial [Odoribacter sp. OttesenSCG-928-G04]|nr:hypothetical protein [Odoribacter sp. OttesenSCG-928-G04]
EDSSRITVGIGYATLDEYVELPVPGGVNAIWGDQRVTIAWEYSALLSVYNAYYIEKSTDGVNFRKLSEIPIVTGDDDVGSRSKRMMFIDSLPDNSSYWYYRIRGVNAFGETGPPSDSIFGRGRQAVPYVPSITHVSIDEYGELELFWNFEASANSWIEGFELQCSERIGGDYRVVKKNISPDRRSLRYAGLGASNYLIVTAVTKDDGVKKSFPVLVQPLDTIPPLPPVGLKGEVDTSGRVRLCWSPGMEHDLLGYRVFRANLRDEEPVYLFDSYITDSCYIDSVPIRNLNPDLYYYVIALDLRYNQSDYSEPLHLKKPDVIPPVSPVISGYFVNDHGIRIEWVNSPDADVKEHLLYRKKRGDKDSLLLKTFPERDATTYVDSDIRGGVYYSYSIFARDSSNLLSAPTPSLTACIVKDPIPDKKIKRFDAVVDRQNILIKLYWTDELPHVESYELYRSLGDEPMCLWRILPAWKKEITDEEPGEELKCHYIIRAVFRDGRNSESRELRID